MWFLIVGSALLSLSAGSLRTLAQSGADKLRVMTYSSFSYDEAVMASFAETAGVEVEFLQSENTSALVADAIAHKDEPIADVLYGIDNTFLTQALTADIFAPYTSPNVADVPQEFLLDTLFRITPVSYGDVCLNYDTAYFAEHDVPLPNSLGALTDPAYRGLLVVEDPTQSSTGLAFLFATIAVFGVDGSYTYIDYWKDLIANDTLIVADWSTAYFEQFSGAADSSGTYPLVVSYASSPPAEVYYMETPPDVAPTASIVDANTCFRQIEFAGALKGAANPEAASAFIDFVLSKTYQESLPLTLFVFPVSERAKLPDVFEQYAQIPRRPIDLNPGIIDLNREAWLNAWQEAIQ